MVPWEHLDTMRSVTAVVHTSTHRQAACRDAWSSRTCTLIDPAVRLARQLFQEFGIKSEIGHNRLKLEQKEVMLTPARRNI
jgi:hypothetical protein